MSLNEEERVILVAREYEKAQQFCKDIGNAELGFWNVVANRLYYALFHAVSAMLIKIITKLERTKVSWLCMVSIMSKQGL